MRQETLNLKSSIAAIVEPLRIRCSFVIRYGYRVGKKCDRRAKKTVIKGVGNMECNLCWRHRKLLQKEFIADIVSVDS